MTLIVGTVEEPKSPEAEVVNVLNFNVDSCGVIVALIEWPNAEDCPNKPWLLGVGVPKGEPDGVVEAAVDSKGLDRNVCCVALGLFVPFAGDGTTPAGVEVEIRLIASLYFLGAPGGANTEVDDFVEAVVGEM